MRRVSIVLVALLTAGCGDAAPPATPAASAVVRAEHGPADVAFVRAMISHHRQGVALAGAAAERPEARILAEAIIVTQQDEIVRMTGWLRGWGEPAPPSAAPAPPAGDPVRALLAHQEKAVELAQREQADGRDPAALAFARQVIESRVAQVDQLRGYLDRQPERPRR